MKSFKIRSTLFFSVLTLVLTMLTISVNAQAGQVAATVDVTPGTSTLWGIIPLRPAQPANTYFYQYTITDGESIIDTIPVQLCLASSTGSWTSFKVNFSDPNGGLTGVTVPGDTTVTPTFTCTIVNIDINTGTLKLADPQIAEEKMVNINIQPKDKTPNNLSIGIDNFPTIHISVKIAPAENDTSCFITDGAGNLLAACDGSAVITSGSDAGRFAITANGKLNEEKSTTPGQFYYNILWTNNTGAAQTVNVNFARTGVSAQGGQAIHAYAFAPPFSGVTVADFQAVNDGIPGGSDDSIESITVPAGWTLWANYHVAWADLGKTAPSDIATACDNANQIFSIIGTISGDVNRVCTSGAKGYKK